MDEPRRDTDRIVFAATIILAIISAAIFLVVYLTLFQYQMLNDLGRTLSVAAMVVSGVAMLLACYLALTGRNRLLTPPGMSGAGWVLVGIGLVIGAPALGLSASFGGGSFGGIPAALFLIIAGAAILQSERNARQAVEDTSRLN
jgi:hypothetical protein